jgi:hypothetical protein
LINNYLNLKNNPMKNTFILFCVFLSHNVFSQSTADSSVYAYEFEKYKVSLPTSWSLDESEDNGVDFLIFAPSRTGKEQILPNISVTEKALNSKLASSFTSAQQYVESFKGMMSLANEDFVLIESIKNEDKSYTIISTSTLQGEDKIKVKIKSLETYFLKDKTIFLASYQASLEDFNLEFDTAKKVILSFIFL